MTKEAELRALRELTDANKPANTANKIDDVSVMKYLDANRRKATSIEEVEIIDKIVHSLFHEGINKVTGRVHGEPVRNNEPQTVAATASAGLPAKPDRKTYMRELMRKRRQK